MFKKFFSFSLALLSIFIWVTPAIASPVFLAPNKEFINITSAISDDTYIAGGQIVIEEDINGDLFIAGGQIDIKGDVSGDVFVSAGSVLIRGNVGDDLRIGAGNITVEGIIGDDVFAGTNILTISDTAVIKGDLITGSGDFRLHGKVLGNVKANFNKGEITGTINGYANLTYKKRLNVGEDAAVLGLLTYMAPTENPNLANIAESVEYRKISSTAIAWLIPAVALGSLIWKYLSILLLGGLCILLLPKYMPKITSQIKKGYFNNLWQGILFLIVVPFLAFVSLMLIIGLPIAVILMSGYVVMLILAGLIASLLIGGYFVKLNSKSSKSRQFAGLVIGAVIYVLLAMVPVVGWLIEFILVSLAIGEIGRASCRERV